MYPVIRKNLLQLIFSGAYLLRWNDKLRPTELLELDKQAHKLILACALWHENTRPLQLAEKTSLGIEIIEGALFDYFYRLVITDIKPPVFYRIKANPEHHRQLTDYVLAELEPTLSPLGSFWERMQGWHREGGEQTLAGRILSAAHLYASRWEFAMIRPLNHFDEEMESIAQSFSSGLDAFRDLPGVNAMLDEQSALGRLATLCGRLRFQIRWTLAPRIPATSVLGHMFVVACLAYFFSLSVDACPARRCNNFFSGLFHDLPELLTRDIISPVKQSVKALPALIREYERTELDRRIIGGLRHEGHAELVDALGYYLGLNASSEFQDCRRENGSIVPLDGFAELQDKWNDDRHNPKDGQMLKACDWLAAFLEAHNSIRNGVSSPHLLDARSRLRRSLRQEAPEQLNLGALLADFD